ncbi:hypothetical protein JHK87_011863 [Glycine soja]|nr:hypothetical protein JHK87_011863 [Glycine soja]
MRIIMKLRIRCLACGVRKNFLEDGLRYSVTYIEHIKRKTGTAVAVVAALKRQCKVEWCYELPCSVSSTGNQGRPRCGVLRHECGAWR